MPLFPPVSKAAKNGLLAIGGDLNVETLITAYQSGIFPWFTGAIPMWYSPDPRFVLFPDELVVSKSMKQVLRGKMFEFTINQAFSEVVRHCAEVKRNYGPGTWITPEMITAYTALHNEGMAISAETWMDGKLVGGLFGVRTGRVFCGESMFSLISNASKYAFIRFVNEVLVPDKVELIDCQIPSDHLKSLGARMIPRKSYLNFLRT